MPKRIQIEERLWSRVDRNGPLHPAKPELGRCWMWEGVPNNKGYGKISEGGRQSRKVAVHVLAYTLCVGPVPDGMVLDHVCHTSDPSCRLGDKCPHRRCVNPHHLTPVLTVDNTVRGRGNGNLEKTSCPYDHPYHGRNLIIYGKAPGRIRRSCRTCHNKRNRERMASKRKRAREEQAR